MAHLVFADTQANAQKTKRAIFNYTEIIIHNFLPLHL